MTGNIKGVVYGILIVGLFLVERFFADALARNIQIMLYSILATFVLLLIRWIWKKTHLLEIEAKKPSMQELDEYSFFTILIPVLFFLGCTFVGFGINNFLQGGSLGVVFVLIVFGLSYLVFGYLIEYHKESQRKKRRDLLEAAKEELEEVKEEKTEMVGTEKKKLRKLKKVATEKLSEEEAKLKQLVKYADEAMKKESGRIKKIETEEEVKIEEAKKKVDALKK